MPGKQKKQPDGGGGGSGGSGGITLPQLASLDLRQFIEFVFSEGLTFDVFTEQRRLAVRIGFDDEADGDLLARIAGVWSRIPVGAEGRILKVASGVPSWEVASAGSLWQIYLDFCTHPVSANG